MSTLATNKLGTLAGTADMSLPTTRPSSTKSAFLDSAGNLTFEDSPVKCEFFVIDGTTKVTKILVDVITTAKDTPYSVLTNSTTAGQFVYGVDLGTWNLPDAVKSAYFKDGNVRWWDLQANGSAQGSTGDFQYGRFNVQMLDANKAIILGDQDSTQKVAHAAWTVYGNSSASKQQSGDNTYWYNDNDASNNGNFGYGQYWLGNSGGNQSTAPWFLNIKFIPWMNGYWKIGGSYTSFGENPITDGYGPRKSYGFTQPMMNQYVRAPSSGNYGDRSYMGAYPAGISVNTGGLGNSEKYSYSYGNFTLTAAIKPTTVVVA